MAERLHRRFRAALAGIAKTSGPGPDAERAAFDPDFYRRRYGDLMILPDRTALAGHFVEHGAREGRIGSATAFVAALEAARGPLPDDFAPQIYRSYHRDLAALTEDWEVTAHYLEYGRDENRPYAPDLSAEEEEYRWSSARMPGRTFADFLASHGMVGGAWLKRFDFGAFRLLNSSWLDGRATTRIEAIQLFVAEGIGRLAPIAMHHAFDPSFYRATYGAAASDAQALYRDWLGHGIGSGAFGSEAQYLDGFLGETGFPEAFDETRYRSAMPRAWPAPRPGRAPALMHFFEFGFAAGVPGVVRGPEAGQLYQQLARYILKRKCLGLARKALDLAVESGPCTASLLHERGELLLTLGLVAEAVADFQRAANDPGSEARSHIRAAESLVGLCKTDAALDRVLYSAPKCRGSAPWRAAAHQVLAAYFAEQGEKARALYRAGGRGRADAIMLAAMSRVVALLPVVDPLPAAPPRPADGPIVLLANRDLPQCDHYRVEQKRRQLEHGGWTVEIYAPADIAAFRQALDRARAAIFYRVPGDPAVLHAILYARALGIPTIYEIDDLIFDPSVYPDPFESFEGQISTEDYANLQHGVPQFRYAMSLCDLGIASTPALADAMRPVVRSGVVHVLRNGLDERNAPYLTRPWTPFSAERVTIFYGSGTKAHNQDFSELVAPALLAVLRRHPQTRLVLAGHLRLDDRFLPFGARVRRLAFTADVDAYWEVLSGVDINLAVLLLGPMSEAKSEIKWLEAAMCGVPSIVSATRTYREILVDGEDVLLAHTVQDWEAALERLVADPALRRRIGAKARDKAAAGWSLDDAVAALRQFLPTPAASEARSAPTSPAFASPAKPRVLIVNVYFPPHTVGGATRVVRDNVDYLLDHAGDRFDLAVVAIDHEAASPYATRIDAYRGVPVLRIAPLLHRDMDWNPADPRMRVVFEEALDRFAPDLVHVHCVQRLTAASVEAAHARGLPYLVTVHDAWWLSDHQFLVDEEGILRMPTADPLDDTPKRDVDAMASIARRRRLGRVLEGAEAILTVSETFARLYRDAGHLGTIAVPNGVSRLDPVARIPSPVGRVRLGHIGGRSAHKGVTLIEHVLRSTPFENLELTLVDHAFGTDHLREEVWGTTPVRIVGRLPQERISKLYARLDVLLAPSIWPESFGLVTREARQAGLWVIASDRGAIGEDVAEGIDGFRVDVATPDGLRNVLARVDSDPTRFLANPPRRERPTRTADDQGAELLAIYDKTILEYRSK